MDDGMNDRLPDADVRRARVMCYVAAAVFAACAGTMAVLPMEVVPAVRWVLAGFNVVIALAVLLYGRSLTGE